MSMQDKGRDPRTSVAEDEGALFAPTPIWDRGRRRGRRTMSPTIAAERRSFAPDDADEVYGDDAEMVQPRPIYTRADRAVMTPSTLAAEEPVAAPDEAPVVVRERARPRSSAAPVAIAVGVLALGAAGFATWYMSRDHGVPELTAGQPTTSEVAVAPVVPVTTSEPVPQVALNATPSAPPTARVRAVQPAREVARLHSVTPPSAAASGVDASANALPDGPQPYAALNPAAQPSPEPPPIAATPPTTAEPETPAKPPALIPETPPQ